MASKYDFPAGRLFLSELAIDPTAQSQLTAHNDCTDRAPGPNGDTDQYDWGYQWAGPVKSRDDWALETWATKIVMVVTSKKISGSN